MKKSYRKEIVELLVAKLQETKVKFKIDSKNDLIEIVRFALMQYNNKGFTMIESLNKNTNFNDSNTTIIVLKELITDTLLSTRTITTINQINKCKEIFNPELIDELYLLQIEDKMAIGYNLDAENNFNIIIVNKTTGKIYNIPQSRTIETITKAMQLLSVMHNVKDPHKHIRMEITHEANVMDASAGKFIPTLKTESIPISKIELVAITCLNSVYYESLLSTECTEINKYDNSIIDEMYREHIIQNINTELVKTSPKYTPKCKTINYDTRDAADNAIKDLYKKDQYEVPKKRLEGNDTDDGFTTV